MLLVNGMDLKWSFVMGCSLMHAMCGSYGEALSLLRACGLGGVQQAALAVNVLPCPLSSPHSKAQRRRQEHARTLPAACSVSRKELGERSLWPLGTPFVH